MSESIIVINFLLDDLYRNELINEKELISAKEILMTQVQEKSEDAA